MVRRARTVPAWGVLVAAVVLATRAAVYALARATPLSERLSGRLGGPRPVVVAAVAVASALVLGGVLLWLAALGVRERWALAESRTRGARPRLDLWRLALRAGGLWVASALAFTAVESSIHWRAGLGFHGLDCLFGPVHVNAVPITAALSILAAAAVGAVEHLLRWARRVVGHALGPRRRRLRAWVALVVPRGALTPPRVLFTFEPLLPRPPPVLASAS